MTENAESFIFRSVEVEQELLLNYKQYLIHIPTNRKNENGEIEKIPCLFPKISKIKKYFNNIPLQWSEYVSSIFTF